MATKSSKPKVKVSAKAEKKEEFSLISNATLKALYADLKKSRRAAKDGAYDALPAGARMDLTDGDVVATAGTGFDSAVGAALLAKTRKNGKVGVIFGEAAAEAFQDALVTAKQYALPLIFVSRTHAADEIAEKRSKSGKHVPAEGHLPRMYVDANDVVAVYRVAHEAIDRARRGRGATWIEGIPFKPEGKRLKADAVAGMEAYLRGKGLL
ncbi:thiamine pyrophosphate-dependent enzyme [Terracidiphilus sp.]|uniref:thiamine pyrophosphate-dependent enzyme n=1 Tax=Terracidiphilus sp. TaxID=1964191 RepID=UPI003C22EF97